MAAPGGISKRRQAGRQAAAACRHVRVCPHIGSRSWPRTGTSPVQISHSTTAGRHGGQAGDRFNQASSLARQLGSTRTGPVTAEADMGWVGVRAAQHTSKRIHVSLGTTALTHEQLRRRPARQQGQSKERGWVQMSSPVAVQSNAVTCLSSCGKLKRNPEAIWALLTTPVCPPLQTHSRPP
jgi:hypothetical protein